MRNTEKLYTELDDLLVAVSLATGNLGLKQCRLPLLHFDKAEIWDENNAPFLWNQAIKTDLGLFGNVHPTDLNNHWDVAVLKGVNDAPAGDESFVLSRFRSIPLKQARGVGALRSTFLGEYSAVVVDHNRDSYQSVRGLMQCLGRDADGNIVWEYLDKNVNHGDEDPKFVSQRMSIFLGIQFSRYYQWRVCLGYPGCPSLGFTTDPTGIRGIFKMRDVPDGRERRASLRNWVSEHWRSTPRSLEEDGTWVRQHLRGAMKFDWMGLVCEIIPSQEAIDKNEDLAELRKHKHRSRH